MSKSAFSLFVYSIYEFALGALLVVTPNLLLTLFGVPETHEVWIRIVGVLAFCFGYINFMASRSELALLFRWSVFTRLSVLVFFVAFVALGFALPILILFGAIDAAAALWTAVCLRRDASDKAQAR
jgi:hypothetical protein